MLRVLWKRRVRSCLWILMIEDEGREKEGNSQEWELHNAICSFWVSSIARAQTLVVLDITTRYTQR